MRSPTPGSVRFGHRTTDLQTVTRADDDRALDAVSDLSRLSDRQLLERLVRTQHRMEIAMSATSDYMTAALQSLDVQMEGLKTRLQEDAAELQAAVAAVAEGKADTAALSAAADRVQATAVAVAGLAQPTAVVDEEQPEAEAGELPAPEDTGSDLPTDEVQNPTDA